MSTAQQADLFENDNLWHLASRGPSVWHVADECKTRSLSATATFVAHLVAALEQDTPAGLTISVDWGAFLATLEAMPV